MTERISLDGEPLTEEQFVEAYADVAAARGPGRRGQPHPLSFFEMVVGDGVTPTFANAPVDAAVVEVGMGGAWDATNVADATVAVILPIASTTPRTSARGRSTSPARRPGSSSPARR